MQNPRSFLGLISLAIHFRCGVFKGGKFCFLTYRTVYIIQDSMQKKNVFTNFFDIYPRHRNILFLGTTVNILISLSSITKEKVQKDRIFSDRKRMKRKIENYLKCVKLDHRMS